MSGDCLEPILGERHLAWVDPSKPAKSGDLVWVQWDADALQADIKLNSTNPQWAADYGAAMRSGPTMIKYLKAADLDYWLIAKGGGFGRPLGNNTILGVVTHVEDAHSAAVGC